MQPELRLTLVERRVLSIHRDVRSSPLDRLSACSRSTISGWLRSGRRATEAVRDLTFGMEEGEFVCVIGPSGCGRTTLLRCISGLLPPTAGFVVLRGQRVVRPPEEMALVFQEFNRTLFPWIAVGQNVTFPLRRLPKATASSGSRRPLEAVDLLASSSQYPWQLSAGMQQRVGTRGRSPMSLRSS